jgi:hypothetical protein
MMNDTLLHVYACSAVHSDCGVGFESARITGLCLFFELKKEEEREFYIRLLLVLRESNEE